MKAYNWTMKEFNLAIVAEDEGLVLHQANCPDARQAAAYGKPVMTLLGCKTIPAGEKRHSCLDGHRGLDWVTDD